MSLRLNKRVYILLSIFIFLLATLIPLIFFTNDYWQKLTFKETSKVRVNTNGTKVFINFEIQDTDRLKFEQFSNNLGVSTKYLEGIELELDNESIEKISQITPLEAALEISESFVKFSSKQTKGLKSSLLKSDVKISTGSANFEMVVNSDSDLRMKVDNPKEVLDFATASSKLNLSSKLTPWFPTLQRIDRMELEVKGKSLNGEIRLK